MYEEPRFDIFSSSPDKGTIWIETVPGLAKTRERMEEIASQVPGRYFVFSAHSDTIIAKIDTSKSVVRSASSNRARDVA